MNKAQIIDFFKENASSIVDKVSHEQIEVYFFLNERLQEVDVSKDSIYQFMFRAYNGMNRIGLTPEFKAAFFRLQNDIKATHEFDFHAILEGLRPFHNRKGQPVLPFSLMTKMVSIINPEDYPVYDTEIIKVFGYKQPSDSDIDKRLTKYLKQYEFIRDTYKELAEAHMLDEAVNLIRRRDVYKPLPGLKLYDFLFNAAGRMLKEIKKQK